MARSFLLSSKYPYHILFTARKITTNVPNEISAPNITILTQILLFRLVTKDKKTPIIISNKPRGIPAEKGMENSFEFVFQILELLVGTIHPLSLES